MIKNKDMFHGSDLEKVERVYGIPKRCIICFSANVNPLGISPRLRDELSSHVDCITSYPDRGYQELRQAIADYLGQSRLRSSATAPRNLFPFLWRPAVRNLRADSRPHLPEYEREIGIAGAAVLLCTARGQGLPARRGRILLLPE